MDSGGNGFPGRTLLAAAVTIIIGLSGWTLTKISQHSEALSTLTQKVDDLTQAVRDHNTQIDAALGRLLDDDNKHSIAIAQDHDAIEALREREVAPERHVEAISPRIPLPPTVPEIGTAVERFFGLRLHRRMLSRRGSLGR